MKEWTEPDFILNGTRLSKAQSMTVRVAIGHFSSYLIHEGLGDDQHGKQITDAYLDRLQEIEDLMKDDGGS